MIGFLLGAAVGAAAAYFLDPDRGKRRRSIARDRAMATIRQASQQMERQARYASSTAYGLSQKAAHMADQAAEDLNDAALTARVESELFRDPDVPKGKININAENGTIVLRGELDRPEQIDAIENRVRQIPGVSSVENLLHLQDTAAPMS